MVRAAVPEDADAIAYVPLVAGPEDGVVGFANFGPSEEESGVSELHAIYVLPDPGALPKAVRG